MTFDLEQEAQDFGEQLTELLAEVLPGPHPPVSALRSGSRMSISTGSVVSGSAGVPDNFAAEPMRLLHRGQHVADLLLDYTFTEDSVGRYPAVRESQFLVRPPRTRRPLVRYEFDRGMRTDPSAHWQIHPEKGGPLSELMEATGAKAQHDLSNLHIPVGGSRFRPCVEDLLEMLIVDCRIDGLDGWKAAVAAGRRTWRLIQVATVVRDAASTAAEALVELGYQVVLPPGGHPDDRDKPLTKW